MRKDTLNLLESMQNSLTEKINKDNIEINKAIANANRGTKNAQKVRDAGYEVDTEDGITRVRNPKTGKSVSLGYNVTRDNKNKVDWKGKLDSTRPSYSETHANFKDEKHRDWNDRFDKRTGKFVPNSRTLTKNKYGRREFDRDDEAYFDGISKNIKDYKKAVEDRDSADRLSISFHNDAKRDEERMKAAQADRDRHIEYAKSKAKQSTDAETKRQEILANARAKHNKANESEELNEKYVDTFGGDTEDFISDLNVIIEAVKSIPTDTFGTHLAQQMVEDFLDTCNRQIKKAKRLDSGDEFYKEAEEVDTSSEE